MPERPKPEIELPPHATKVFAGEIFDVYQWEQERFDGTTATFERLARPDSVVVIPITEEGKIIVLEEEQPGRPPFLAVPGGRVDPGEEPVDAARRELKEETGMDCRELAPWFATQVTSKLDWAIFCFIAHGCVPVEEAKGEPGEKLSQKALTFEEFTRFVRDPRFHEKEVTLRVQEALLDDEKMRDLKELLRIS
ncbi:NUDIX domain-containing protein [Patescibacteria group bacterium]|jgi:8-oxo-dGTP pyrophosphatase MutT (NUDIX family)|nr:NUDIX domain-containing protein [Patescibacteria group bacterium]